MPNKTVQATAAAPPRQVIDDFVVNESTGRLDNVIDGERAENIIKALDDLKEIAESE